jgi:histidine phosphotransferase ChpT
MDLTVDLRVAELLVSRLAHELVNPIGAVSNGVELIAELGSADADALRLIEHSARAAAARLQFYRLAYGQASGTNADLSLAEARPLAEAVMTTARLRLDWPAGAAAERRLGREALQLALNLLVLAAEALPRGGVVALGLAAGPAGPELFIEARGEQAALSPEARAALDGAAAPEALSARSVHAYFTGRVAARLGRPVALGETPGALRFHFDLPAGH